jgi:DNA-binding transcriptional MerR regulator/methylmalonyl-CoA mutase cobalamin-binding subunit
MGANETDAIVQHMSIGAVERDTGLSKDTLRVWERRYGFPAPERDPNGERVYPPAQVEKLRLIRRLMDSGHRPGKIIAQPVEELRQLAEAEREPADQDLEAILDLLMAHDSAGLKRMLSQRLVRQGLQRFVLDTVAPLNTLIGDAWMGGRLAVFEEHLYTETMQGLLRSSLANAPHPAQPPRVLLASLPGEEHCLGLLMAEALLTMEGATCIPLGTQVPAADLAKAARAHRADIVGLSFSAAFPTRNAVTHLIDLRAMLPERFSLWAGGAGIARHSKPVAGVTVVKGLEHLVGLLTEWRALHARNGAPVA